jgi:hypothetical protein
MLLSAIVEHRHGYRQERKHLLTPSRRCQRAAVGPSIDKNPLVPFWVHYPFDTGSTNQFRTHITRFSSDIDRVATFNCITDRILFSMQRYAIRIIVVSGQMTRHILTGHLPARTPTSQTRRPTRRGAIVAGADDPVLFHDHSTVLRPRAISPSCDS